MKTFTQVSIATALLASMVSGQYQIVPDSVNITLRDYWCQQQLAQCPLICLQTAGNTDQTDSNDCDPTQLTYSCVCDNGQSPNVSEYSQTLPFFICQEWGQQCVSNCNGAAACQSACIDNHPCGAQNPTRQNTSTLMRSKTSTLNSAQSAASSVSAAGGKIITTDGVAQTLYGVSSGSGSDTSSAVSHVRVWALSAGQTFGTMALVGGIFGGFAVLL